MRILLIQSYLGRRELLVLPLGLAFIASSLKGHDVSIFDPNIYKTPYKALEEKILVFQPEILGVSLRNIDTTQITDPFFYFEHFLTFIRYIRKLRPDGLIVVGGNGFSLYPIQIMKVASEIDIGIMFEGEDAFRELLSNLHFPEKVRGIFIRKGEEIIFTGKRPYVDFDNIPSPAFHLTKIDRYRAHDEFFSIGVQTKRGCSLGCAYCVYPFLAGKHLRLRNPVKVVDEIEALVKGHDVKFIFFADSVFNIPTWHATQICREIIRRGLKLRWTGYHNERYLTDDYVSLAVDSGCTRFSFSPDGISQKSLRALNKNIGFSDIKKSFYLVKNHPNAHASYNFFMVSPELGLGAFIRLIAFCLKAKLLLKKRLLRLRLSVIRVEPNTEIFQYATKNDLIKMKKGLLPRDSKELTQFYYTSGPSILINTFALAYLFLKRFFDKLRRRKILNLFVLKNLLD